MSHSEQHAALPTLSQLTEALQALIPGASSEIAGLLPGAVAELDRAITAQDFEPTLAATAVARQANGTEYARAERVVARLAEKSSDAAMDLRMMESSAGIALGLAIGLRIGGAR